MPERRLAFATGVTALADVVYARRLRYRPLTLDLYLPPASATAQGTLPLVVHVHGGAWITGTPRHNGAFTNFPGVLAALAARGYVVASVEYRLDGEAPFPAAFDDVSEAIRFLRRNATVYHLDPRRVAVWGASAGGQLAAMVSVACGDTPYPASNEPTESESACVQAGVSWYGVHDFRLIHVEEGKRGPAPYLGCATRQCPQATLARASAVIYADADDPPMLLIHGSADALVPLEQSEVLHKALQSAGAQSTLMVIPEVDHGFIGKSPESTHAASMRALEATFEFFDRNLR